MEGPSLVLAREEFARFKGMTVKKASGTATLPFAALKKSRFVKAESWGKHLILLFTGIRLRIHFLMFGSYRIGNPRVNRTPKLELQLGPETIYFYSCAIKELPENYRQDYDATIDLMSARWDAGQAEKAVADKPHAMVCDLLMDQSIFAGLGNIMKNETLFNLKMHPETKAGALSRARIRALVKEARDYALRFYEWKKINQLKRNWRIMRKKTCPACAGKVRKRATGKLQRLSHYCPRCQRVENGRPAKESARSARMLG